MQRWLALGTVTLAVWTSNPAAAARLQTAPDSLPTVLERAAAAVARFEREFAAVVAEEHLVQRAGRPGILFRQDSTVLGRRELRSDLLFVQVPGHDGWLPFRDVYEVDGRAVRDRTERLQRLFLETPDTAVTTATRISNESSRYNLGPVVRTINTPTFGMMLLRPSYRSRLEFKRRGQEELAGEATWRITFVERARPTIVRTLKGEDVPIEGTLWIEPSSGRVLKTLIKTIGTPDTISLREVSSSQTLMRVEVTFAPSDTLGGVLVPERMTEWSRASGDRTEVTGVATYTRFRRFTVNTAEAFQADAGCVPLGAPKPSLEFSYRLTDSRGTSSDFTTVWLEATATSSRGRTTRASRGGGTVEIVSRHRTVYDVSVIDETVQTEGGGASTTTFLPGMVGDPFGRACTGRTWPIMSVTATNRSGRGTFSTKSDAGELKMLGIHVSVTVPAGTFDTVHYRRTTTSAARGPIVDEYWKSIEHGVVVRHLSTVAGVTLTEELQAIR